MKKTGPHKPVAGFTSTTHAFPSRSTAVVMPIGTSCSRPDICSGANVTSPNGAKLNPDVELSSSRISVRRGPG